MARIMRDFLSTLLNSYEYYYSITEGDADSGLPLAFRAEFHARDEGYVLIKKAKIWAAESNEYVYVFSVPELDLKTAESCMDYALADGLPRIEPHPEHKDSYIIAIFLADVIQAEAARAIRRRKYHKDYKFGMLGWSSMKTAAVELEKEMVLTNKMGRNLKKFFKKLLRSE